MNIKKAIVCGLMGTVPFIIVGAICSQLLFALFPYLKTGISGTISPTKMAITMIWMGISSFNILNETSQEPRPGGTDCLKRNP